MVSNRETKYKGHFKVDELTLKSRSGKEIKREIIKTDEKHFNFSKERLVLLGKTVNNFTVPPVQTCLKCSKLSVCERYVRSKKRGRKNGTTTKAN